MGKRYKRRKLSKNVKCVSCGKGVQHSKKGFTWKEDQKCPSCYCRDNNLKKVKINKEGRCYDLVYVQTTM